MLPRISFPGDVGWKIISSNGEVAAEVPVGGYSLSSCYDVVDEVIALRANGEYTLSVLDGSGDGRKLLPFVDMFICVVQ